MVSTYEDESRNSLYSGSDFSPTYAGDVARGVFQGCKCGLKGVYNLANTEYFSHVELVKQFALSLNMKGKLFPNPNQISASLIPDL